MSATETKTDDTAVAAQHVPVPGASGKIYDIVKYPSEVLATKGERVTKFDTELRTLVADMFESMYAAHGIGLAAPQIGISKQITVIDVSFKERPEDRLVLINPVIVEREGKQVEEEGCLSLPEIREKVHRAAWVNVRAQNEHGEFFEIEGEELLSRALQHEIDHLHGILFIDHLSRLKRDLVHRRIRKLQKSGQW